MSTRTSAVFLSPLALLAIALVALAPSPRALQQPATQPPFRGGVNFVRADVYVTRDGRFVPDLTQDEFELVEDGVPQRIERFEVITANSRSGDVISTPRTLAESRTSVETARGRLFVVFLDTGHVDAAASFQARRPLATFLDRVIGAEDLVAVMTTEMSASDLTFQRRGETVERVLADRWPWGDRDAVNSKDPVEDQYLLCYPGLQPREGCASDAGIATRMILRRREKRALDAMSDLVYELETLRDERKTVVTLSNGWLLYRPDNDLMRPINCEVPGPSQPRVDPKTGRPTLAPLQQGVTSNARTCDADRRLLATLDNAQAFRDLTDRANRGNVSFYTLDPRGAAPFDEPIAQPNGQGLGLPSAPISIFEDKARLGQRQDSLRDLAVLTDGTAVLNQNNLDAGFRRIAADLSGYYLLGYSSSGKLDGKFHSIRVRVKRAGLDVRARRGYLAPTQAELSRANGPVAKSPSAAAAPTAALAATAAADLARSVRETPLRLAFTASGAGASATVWVQGELDSQLRPSDADVSIVLSDNSGAILASKREHLVKESRAFRSALTPTAVPSGGEYMARVRLQSAAGDWDTVTATAVIPVVATTGSPVALLSRRGPSTGNRILPAADHRFRRSEQLIAEMPLAVAPLTARLLDRNGTPMSIPVASSERRDESGVVWQAGQVGLNALAPGDYVMELSDAGGHVTAVAFRVVP